MRQRSQQKYSDFAAELKRQGELANVSDMTSAAYEAMILVNGCVEKDLIQEFLKMDPADFTFTKIVKKAKVYEAQQVTYDFLKQKEKKGFRVCEAGGKRQFLLEMWRYGWPPPDGLPST